MTDRERSYKDYFMNLDQRVNMHSTTNGPLYSWTAGQCND